MGRSRSDDPDLVTQATSAAKPSTWSFSVLSLDSVMKSGKYAFWTPLSLILASNQAWMPSHTA